MIGEPDLVARGPLRKMNVEAMTHLKKKKRKKKPHKYPNSSEMHRFVVASSDELHYKYIYITFSV